MANVVDLGAVRPWPSRMDPFSGLGAGLTFPLPTRYGGGLAGGARPLPAPSASFGAVVRSAAQVTSRPKAVNYARAGYAAARKLADSEAKNREAWQRVGQYYAFVHDLDLWVQSRSDVNFDEPLRDRYVNDLRAKLAFADAEGTKLRKSATPSPMPGPTVQVPGPVAPTSAPEQPTEASIVDSLFRGRVFGVPKPVAWIAGGGLLILGLRAAGR